MKIELHDGTELDLPDSMTDEQVQAIVDALTKANAVAQQASLAAKEAQARVAPPIVIPVGKGHDDVIAALARLEAVCERGFARLFAAQMADTVVVQDPLKSEPDRARKELR